MIFTIKGQEVLIDNCDADLLGQTLGGYDSWCINDCGYLVGSVGGRLVSLHKLLQERIGFIGNCDHMNRNRLDNRRCNLRGATSQQNNVNRTHANNSLSGYRGVVLDRGKYKATIKFNRKSIYIGRFATAEEASVAYNKKGLELFGEFFVPQ